MRIDAHQHYWKLDRGDYGWLTPESGVLYRDYLPADLLPHLRSQRIDGTIVVQAAATHEETSFLLELSDAEPSIAGVVGWLDLNSPHYKAQYRQFSRHPKFAGFRVMIQEMEDAREVLKPQIIEALTYFAVQEVPVDLLMRADQLDATVELLDCVPGLRAVIDHIAKPHIAQRTMEPWKTQMEAIARHPNVHCKLSGMVTEADHSHWRPADFQPYVEHIVRIFGPRRLLFGSDWPVCLLAARYDEAAELLQQLLPPDWTAEELAGVFGRNALRFYKLQFTK